ncbi:MAG: glycoside hydrolase family 31 protein [Melioribacteraceae bacterium]|nr:glycoside hydrolase family 31 protein [Melioribacteraceae bacterium]
MENFLKLFFVFLIFTSVIFGKFEFVGKIKSFSVEKNRVEFILSNAKFNIYVLESNIIRFRFTNQNEFSKAPSYAVIYKQQEKTNFTFKEENEKFILSTDELIIHIKKDPCRISVYDKEMNLINQDEDSFGVSFDADEVRCHKKLFNDEKFIGLGEKSKENLIKNGDQYTMWNTDFPAYTSTKDELYMSIPFFMGIRNFKTYGIYFDNTHKSQFNMGAANNRLYWFGAARGEMDYYFIYGPEMKRIISDYTKLTGRMELPPMWAIGYQQSRWSYYPESKVREIANGFRNRNIPCDVIYFDIHYMDEYRVFTWDKNRFPDPPKLLSDLKNNGFKVITIIDPGVKADPNYHAAKEGLEKDLFIKYPDGVVYQGEVWPSWSYFPDFTKKETRQWWGLKLSSLLKDGVEGFWNDMNEPATWGGGNIPDIVQFDDNGFIADHKKIRNVYALEMAHATREGLKKYSNKRHFILSRAGFSGIQRYAANWTGDNATTEEHLRLALIMPVNIGLSGQPFIGSDVGGFMNGEPTNEMYIRWMQLGAFTPFFRGHSSIDTKAREPWAFNEFTEENVRQAIQLRYKLIPFWYNEFYNSSKSGLPIMRAMFLNYQDDPNCYNLDAQYQFMIGENLLVAPIVNSTDKTKKLYLPKGNWYNWLNNKVENGGEYKIVEVPINKIPLFIKEGGIIPMQEVQNYVGEKTIDELELIIFPSAKSTYSFYEDDGISYDYENGKYSITNFTSELKGNNYQIEVKKEKDNYNSNRKTYLFTFLNSDKPKEISSDKIDKSEISFNYDSSNKTLKLKVPDKKDFRININF